MVKVGKSLHAQPLHQHRDQQARIEPAAQEGADLNVAHHVQAQRLDDLLVEFVDAAAARSWAHAWVRM